MTYEEMKALFDGMTAETYDESKILDALKPPKPSETPKTPPVEEGKTPADKLITMTAAEFMKYASEINAAKNPKPTEEEKDDAEIYL